MDVIEDKIVNILKSRLPQYPVYASDEFIKQPPAVCVAYQGSEITARTFTTIRYRHTWNINLYVDKGTKARQSVSMKKLQQIGFNIYNAFNTNHTLDGTCQGAFSVIGEVQVLEDEKPLFLLPIQLQITEIVAR